MYWCYSMIDLEPRRILLTWGRFSLDGSLIYSLCTFYFKLISMLFFWEAASFVLMGLECVNHIVLFVFWNLECIDSQQCKWDCVKSYLLSDLPHCFSWWVLLAQWRNLPGICSQLLSWRLWYSLFHFPHIFWWCYLVIYLLLHLFGFLPEFVTGLIHLVMLFFEIGHKFGWCFFDK